jgi:septal ring factor EnvC (AmiA/AmiB activator)
VRRRRIIEEAQANAAEADTQTTIITAEQERIRNNMAELDRASALYNRYVDELDEQETRLKELRANAQRLREQVRAADADLRAYLDTLSLGDE